MSSFATITFFHDMEIGYSGEYESVNFKDDKWQFNYDLQAYAKINETISLNVLDFYQFDTEIIIDFFKLSLWKQNFKFVHPLAILDGKMSDPQVDIVFDFKTESTFEVIKAFEVSVEHKDNMKANFNKKLKNILGEVLNYAITSDEDYVWPTDASKNIADFYNYLPGKKDFKKGGRVFTSEEDKIRIPKSSWTFSIVLDIIRSNTGNQNWEFEPFYLTNHWLFKTRDTTTDLVLV